MNKFKIDLVLHRAYLFVRMKLGLDMMVFLYININAGKPSLDRMVKAINAIEQQLG